MKTILRFSSLLLAAACSTNVLAGAAGTLDPTFDTDGRTTFAFDLGAPLNGHTADRANAMARAPGGRTYLAGSATTAFGTPLMAVTRLQHDGSPDPMFGTGGRVVLNQPLGTARVLDAVTDPEGRLVLVGMGAALADDPPQVFACRMLPDGSLDSTFGSPASPGCRLAALGMATSVALQPDGRIVMAGDDPFGRGHVIRLNTDGTKDFDFGVNGIATVQDVATRFRDILVLPDGDLLAAGSVYNGSSAQDDHLLARFDSHGQLDAGFGKNGLYEFGVNIGPSGYNNDRTIALWLLDDGGFLAAGEAETDAKARRLLTLHRFTASGSLDPEFGVSGLQVYDPCALEPGGCDLRAYDILGLDDNKIVLAGGLRAAQFGSFFALRLLPDGTQDASFGDATLPGQEGFVAVPFALVPGQADEEAYRVLARGARILLGGAVEVPQVGNHPLENHDFGAMRLDHGIDEIFQVTPDAGAGGSLAPDAAQPVLHSDITEFVVTPDPGFVLTHIEGCGGALYGNVYSTDPVVEDCTVTAEFTAENTEEFFVVSTNVGANGALSPEADQNVLEGDVVEFTVTPDPGFTAQVTGCGGSLAGNTYATAPVVADCEVSAQFVPDNVDTFFTVSTNVGANGALSPEADQNVLEGDVVEFTVTPDPGFTAQVTGCGGSLVGNTYTTAPVVADCKVSALFQEKTGSIFGDGFEGAP